MQGARVTCSNPNSIFHGMNLHEITCFQKINNKHDEYPTKMLTAFEWGFHFVLRPTQSIQLNGTYLNIHSFIYFFLSILSATQSD